MMHVPLKTVALAACLALAASPAAAATYVAALSGANENPANASPGTGSATLTIVGNVMTLTTSFSGLTGNVTAAHIHCCVAPPANVGVATPVPSFPGFPSGVTSGSYSQSFDLTLASSYNPAFVTSHGGTVAFARDAFLAGLDAGQAYLNIHTNLFPGGEIRGQLTAVPEPAARMLMIAGFGLVGGALRRRKPQAVVFTRATASSQRA